MKKVVYVIVGLIALYLILCLFGAKELSVTRSITINAKPEKLIPLLADLKFFNEKWSPWTEKDPNMKVEYEGTRGAVGYKYKWSGNSEVRSGSMAVDSILPNRVVMALVFGEGMHTRAWFDVIPEGEGSKVTWSIYAKTPFIFRAMHIFFNMEKNVGGDFEKGLEKLKQLAESMPEEEPKAAYEVKELEWPEKTFVGKRTTISTDKITAFYGENLPVIFAELGKNKIQPEMAPLGIFWSYDEQKQEADMAAALCVPAGTKLKGFEQWVVPASKVLHIAYYGDYSKVGPAHTTMDEYMKKNNLVQSLVIEEYANDPAKTDTANWLTNIYYVIKK